MPPSAPPSAHAANRRFLVWWAAGAAALALLAIPFLDRPLAEAVHDSRVEHAAFSSGGTRLLDALFLRNVSKFAFGLGLAALGALFACFRPARAIARRLLFVAGLHLLTTLLTGVSKNIFGRLRPFQAFERLSWDNLWFQAGSSFPSGHTGFFFGLFFPLAILYPRGRWPLAILPAFVGVSRIIDSDHFLSDVAAAIAIAALTTWLGLRFDPRTSNARQPGQVPA